MEYGVNFFLCGHNIIESQFINKMDLLETSKPNC